MENPFVFLPSGLIASLRAPQLFYFQDRVDDLVLLRLIVFSIVLICLDFRQIVFEREVLFPFVLLFLIHGDYLDEVSFRHIFLFKILHIIGMFR